MADTIISNTPGNGSGDSAAGWVVALIVLVAVVIGGVYVYRHGIGRAAPGGTNINVTLPSGSGSTGGATQ